MKHLAAAIMIPALALVATTAHAQWVVNDSNTRGQIVAQIEAQQAATDRERRRIADEQQRERISEYVTKEAALAEARRPPKKKEPKPPLKSITQSLQEEQATRSGGKPERRL